MKRSTAVTALVAGSALISAGCWLRRRHAVPTLPDSVIPIVTPVIDLRVAEEVLTRMERLYGDQVTLLLHTLGGCATSCVMIANALQQFERSTAIVPYMATSGGTLIALSARQLHMGKSASLSAVDPILDGQRARYFTSDDAAPGRQVVQEYEAAIRRFLRETLTARLGADPAALERAMAVFMGEHAPHEWPIRRSDVAALGLPLYNAAPSWAAMVDAYRRRWW